jgi:hypothetical protein
MSLRSHEEDGSRLRVGQVVEVRPAAEILATLDENAATDALPFMPEMLRFVGRRFTVSAHALKLCDTRSDGTGNRLFHDTVYLEDLRCDGSGHDGCQAGCRLLWRTAWLRPVGADGAGGGDASSAELEARTQAAATRGAGVYRCQATELGAASEPFPPGDRGRKYLDEVRCGNVGVGRFLRVLGRAVWRKLGRKLGLHGEMALWSEGKPPASTPLGLRPGELVQVKSRREIAKTLDENGRNRGLAFDWEMLPHCGRTYRVQDRVGRFIDENTGTMVELKNECLILEGVMCSGDLSVGRWFCPRAIYPYWRDDWLRRADGAEKTEA